MPVLGIVVALLKNEVLGEAIGHLITLQEEMRHMIHRFQKLQKPSMGKS